MVSKNHTRISTVLFCGFFLLSFWFFWFFCGFCFVGVFVLFCFFKLFFFFFSMFSMLVPDVSIMVKNKSVYWNLIACGLKINPRCPAWSKGMGADELVASGIFSPWHICPPQPVQVLYNIYIIHFIFKKGGGKLVFFRN